MNADDEAIKGAHEIYVGGSVTRCVICGRAPAAGGGFSAAIGLKHDGYLPGLIFACPDCTERAFLAAYNRRQLVGAAA